MWNNYNSWKFVTYLSWLSCFAPQKEEAHFSPTLKGLGVPAPDFMRIKLVLAFHIFCCFLLVSNAWGEKVPKLGPNEGLFIHIRTLWLQKNFSKFKNLLDERVKINLAVIPYPTEQPVEYRYPLEQAVGILKGHFSSINILKLEYIPKKMTISHGVAVYEYQINANGARKKQHLHFYLEKRKREEKEIWLISAIREI
jgi:hypothetical protein